MRRPLHRLQWRADTLVSASNSSRGDSRGCSAGSTQRSERGGDTRGRKAAGTPGCVIAMPDILIEYLPIVIFLGLAGVLGSVLLVLPLLLAPNHPDPEKLSAYECGFNAFDDARLKFDVRFYLVAILFIIFDLEVTFLFPWAITLGKTGVFGFWSMMAFLGVLTVGFIYEWKKGALEWE
jgi:NADH-quinone oxidoreductase subunit A